jgi:hypothetical protein
MIAAPANHSNVTSAARARARKIALNQARQAAQDREHIGRNKMNFGKRMPHVVERRQAARQACNVSATIILESGTRIGCVVANFSSIGALLVVPSILGLPAQFDLQAANGSRRRVEVARRGRSFVGVRFV